MPLMMVDGQIREVEIAAVVTHADGSVTDYGTIAHAKFTFWHKCWNKIRRTLRL